MSVAAAGPWMGLRAALQLARIYRAVLDRLLR